MIKERTIARGRHGKSMEVVVKQNRWAEYRALLLKDRAPRYIVTSLVAGTSEKHHSASEAWACYDRYTIEGGVYLQNRWEQAMEKIEYEPPRCT
jgi:hypothetical protein